VEFGVVGRELLEGFRVGDIVSLQEELIGQMAQQVYVQGVRCIL
jgi:hypothetical protein